MKILFVSVLILMTVSCSTKTCANNQKFNSNGSNISEKMTLPENVANMKKIKVAKPDGTLQCAQGQKITVEEMQKDLKDITVYSSTSQNDGKIRIQMCGAPTGANNVYEISENDLSKAKALGFNIWIK